MPPIFSQPKTARSLDELLRRGRQRFGNGGGRFGRNLAPLRMHHVLRQILGLHRQEGARADMQRHEDAAQVILRRVIAIGCPQPVIHL